MTPTEEAKRRLRMDYMDLIKEPLPYIVAHPQTDNILVWHYVIRGPDDTSYKDGIYHGVLEFPYNFPFKPPAIKMLTPNGRFKCGVRLCLSISDFHPEKWSPLWSVSAVLNGLLSFMLEETRTAGSIQTDSRTKKKLAQQSWTHNLANELFCQLFPELAEEAKNKLVNNSSDENQQLV